MPGEEFQEVCAKFGFAKGSWPFRYLEAPICNKPIKAKDCQQLIQKMTARIQT